MRERTWWQTEGEDFQHTEREREGGGRRRKRRWWQTEEEKVVEYRGREGGGRHGERVDGSHSEMTS